MIQYFDFVKVESGFYKGISGIVLKRRWFFWYVVDASAITVVVPRWRLKTFVSPVAEKFRDKRLQRAKEDAQRVSKSSLVA